MSGEPQPEELAEHDRAIKAINAHEGRSAAACSSFQAQFAGAKAALEDRKQDANPFTSDNPLHWQWLHGWLSTREKMRSEPNVKANRSES